jgi:hypothetical protein
MAIILLYFGYLCLVETLIIEGNDGFTVGNRYLEK